MVLIILSWIYILFTTINLGFVLDRILVLKNKDFVITSFLGLFSVTVLASIWAIFGRINVEFHIFLLLSNLVVVLKFKNEIADIYKNFYLELRNIGKFLKYYLAIICILIVAQCSTAPYVIDNETYYIQTIKWLNEYGFVKGLVNLHLFLGQTSGWHITQSVFSFSFLYGNFNDLSGYCLLLGMICSIIKLNSYYAEKKNFNFLLIGAFPFASIFYFQFISAPSPDMPVYVLTFLIFFLFLENCKNCSSEKFIIITTLVLYLLYIKYSTLPYILIPIILLALNFKILFSNFAKVFIIAATVLGLFTTKNYILTGYPLFPINIFNIDLPDYAFPLEIQKYYFDKLQNYGYSIYKVPIDSFSRFELLEHWINLPKLKGLMNKLIVVLTLIVPVFIYKFQNKTVYWLLYFLMIAQLILLFAISPQYRFFMNFIIFFGTFCFIAIVKSKKNIQLVLATSLIPIVILLFVPINLGRLSANKAMIKTNTISLVNIFVPSKNSNSTSNYKVIQLGNLRYNSPLKKSVIWATGDVDLPSVSIRHVKLHRRKFKVIPQMRTGDLKGGFYSKRVEDENYLNFNNFR